jgi:uncharacterized protein YjdB
MRSLSSLAGLPLALVTGLLLVGCGDSGSTDPEPTPVTLSSITVTPATATLAINGTQALTVTGSYSNATTAPITTGVTFASSATSVATVTGAGVVTAVAGGNATITATTGGRTATSLITVTPAAPTLSSIAITPATVSLVVAATQQLGITGTFSDASTSTLASGVTFSTSSAAIATVSAAGLVTAVAPGSATITATHTASTRTATRTVTVTAPPASNGAVVFSDNYDAGVSFTNFDGATNDISIDASVLNNGRKTIKAVVTGSGGYSGGAFVSAAPRNLSAYNALTFWARGSVANGTLKVGVGNNGVSTRLNAEAIGIPLTTTFTKFIIPLPDPSKFVNVDGLFHFADGPNNYTVWFSDVQFENLPASQVAAPTAALAAWPAINVPVGTPAQMNPAPNTVNFTTPALPNGGKLTDVAWRWFTLTSSNPSVATVSADGQVTGVSAGTATITATMNGIAVASGAPVTVTAALAQPNTIAPAPSRPAANVISLFTTVYTNRAVDTWRTGWSGANSELTDPFVIAGRNVKRYSLFNFVGIEFGIASAANIVDATEMTHVHFDLWTPNPSANLEIQLVNDASGTAAIGKYQAGALASGQWVSLDVPLASFAGLAAKSKLQQLLFVAAGPTVLYVDNVYFYKP